MIFDVTKASSWNYKKQVNINSLEELKLFMEFEKSDVIIYRPRNFQDSPNYVLCIYDSSVE